jgi:biotin carboxylase
MVIEMSPRLGGNGIPELINHHTGIDLIEIWE